MKDYLIDFLFNILPPFLTAVVTTYIVHKLTYKQTLKTFIYTHKQEVFEQFICSYNDIYSIIYQRTPIIIISSINNVLLYLNADKQAPFIKLRNNLTSATEQDIPELIQQFNICVEILNEEIKSLNKVK